MQERVLLSEEEAPAELEMSFPPGDSFPDYQNNFTNTLYLLAFMIVSVLLSNSKFRGRKNFVVLGFCILTICNLQMGIFLAVNTDRYGWFYGMMAAMRLL
mmetsp:Transcript_37021/g.35748  ORF Transcript_37021/g.35748 Transcript_37021/m.35748 type:complete len:100 (+) Transcript_37021:189-488(+)